MPISITLVFVALQSSLLLFTTCCLTLFTYIFRCICLATLTRLWAQNGLKSCLISYAVPALPHTSWSYAVNICLFTQQTLFQLLPVSKFCAACRVVTKMNIIIKSSPQLCKVHSLILEPFPQWGVGYTNTGAPWETKEEQPTFVEKNLARDYFTKDVKNELSFLGEWRFTRWTKREICKGLRHRRERNWKLERERSLFAILMSYLIPLIYTDNAKLTTTVLIFILNIVFIKSYYKL